MKRILATLALLLGALHILSAIPAYRGPITVTQPDGSTLVIRVHGDEWFNYVTDENGNTIARGEDGFFHPVDPPTAAQRAEAARMRRAASQMRAAAVAQAPSMTQGTHRIPVILVSFKDVPFTIDNPREAFDALLNQEGYSANGGTGSVHDFYYENSHGDYNPVFDVFGPYELSGNSEDYVNSAGNALKEACQALNAEINFSVYDSDGNGSVDMTLMYYAGHNPAEGADKSKYIWPHQGYVSGSPRLDGKYLEKYFCTSELKGASGSRMCGIGTTTHEFAHSLGLPDFYDTDYEDNGEAGGLYSYSTMDSGAYNNNGRTPPYFNAEELILLGWMDGLTEVERQGALTIPPIRDRVAYKVPTSVSGEYFVLECRAKTGWDSALPGNGLLVYHVDKSNRQVSILQYGSYRTYTAANLWNNWVYSNAINENGSHPCFYLVPAGDPSSLYFTKDQSQIPFPGTRRVTQYTPVDWEGATTDFKFTNITFSNGQSSLMVNYTTTPGIAGRVLNTSAKPVRDATVAVYAGTTQVKVTVTGADGTYSFEDAALADGSYTLKVTCNGYVNYETDVTVGRKVETVDVYLRKEGESSEVLFSKYDPAGPTQAFGADGITDFAAAIQLTADELAAYAGKQVKTISFQPAGAEGATVSSAYVFVEYGGRRRYTQKVDNLRPGVMNTVNVVSWDFLIPSGTPVYVGYGLLGCSADEPVLVQECAADKMGYYGRYAGGAITWKDMNKGGKYYTPVLSVGAGERVEPELGFNYIANPGNGSSHAGERFELSLVRYEDDPYSTLSWTFDGQAVQGGSVTLTAGAHTVEAHLTYPDGTAEVIRMVINAQ